MGGMVSDSTTRDMIAQINARFEAGDAILEMVALQKEFKIFSPKHSLYASWLVLNIKVSNPRERAQCKNWAENYMKKVPYGSNQKRSSIIMNVTCVTMLSRKC